MKNSKCLIIIGYGGGDVGINKRIISNLHSPCFVYDIVLNPELKKVIEAIDCVENYQNMRIEKFQLPTTINF